jgi:hypothetical protein
MAATVLMRLVAPLTSLLPASGLKADALLTCTDGVPDGGEIVHCLVVGLAPELWERYLVVMTSLGFAPLSAHIELFDST